MYDIRTYRNKIVFGICKTVPCDPGAFLISHVFQFKSVIIEFISYSGRDMLILFNNSFPRLIMSSERLIKSPK